MVESIEGVDNTMHAMKLGGNVEDEGYFSLPDVENSSPSAEIKQETASIDTEWIDCAENSFSEIAQPETLSCGEISPSSVSKTNHRSPRRIQQVPHKNVVQLPICYLLISGVFASCLADSHGNSAKMVAENMTASWKNNSNPDNMKWQQTVLSRPTAVREAKLQCMNSMADASGATNTSQFRSHSFSGKERPLLQSEELSSQWNWTMNTEGVTQDVCSVEGSYPTGQHAWITSRTASKPINLPQNGSGPLFDRPIKPSFNQLGNLIVYDKTNHNFNNRNVDAETPTVNLTALGKILTSKEKPPELQIWLSSGQQIQNGSPGNRKANLCWRTVKPELLCSITNSWRYGSDSTKHTKKHEGNQSADDTTRRHVLQTDSTFEHASGTETAANQTVQRKMISRRKKPPEMQKEKIFLVIYEESFDICLLTFARDAQPRTTPTTNAAQSAFHKSGGHGTAKVVAKISRKTLLVASRKLYRLKPGDRKGWRAHRKEVFNNQVSNWEEPFFHEWPHLRGTMTRLHVTLEYNRGKRVKTLRIVMLLDSINRYEIGCHQREAKSWLFHPATVIEVSCLLAGTLAISYDNDLHAGHSNFGLVTKVRVELSRDNGLHGVFDSTEVCNLECLPLKLKREDVHVVAGEPPWHKSAGKQLSAETTQQGSVISPDLVLLVVCLITLLMTSRVLSAIGELVTLFSLFIGDALYNWRGPQLHREDGRVQEGGGGVPVQENDAIGDEIEAVPVYDYEGVEYIAENENLQVEPVELNADQEQDADDGVYADLSFPTDYD